MTEVPSLDDAFPGDCEVLVVGSGAGGSVVAATLAEAGLDVLVLEEGPRVDPGSFSTHSPRAFATMYRDGGMTPLLGPASVAFVEGRCVGGSTEINSAFWRRTPEECLARWTREHGVRDLDPAWMALAFERFESELSVGVSSGPLPASSRRMQEGFERLGWGCTEAPRCQSPETREGGAFAPGAKRSMSRTLLPRAVRAGARVVSDARVVRVLHEREGSASRATGALVHPCGDARRALVVRARHVFVCGGPVQTPALLLRSGIARGVGRSLRIHPMTKVAARFDETMDAHRAPLPVFQSTEFADAMIGGSVFTPGFLAMTLADSRRGNLAAAMGDWRRMAIYYVAVKGSELGRVHAWRGFPGTIARYGVSESDRARLILGVERLVELLFAAGAREVLPGIRGAPALRGMDEARRFLSGRIAARDLGLGTVHAFSSCPMGDPDAMRATGLPEPATDSFGLARGFRNLRLADASVIPDSPGVNPQATTMALALRSAERFLEDRGVDRAAR